MLLRRLLTIRRLIDANRDNHARHARHAARHDKPLHGEIIEMKPGPMRKLVLAALLLVLVITRPVPISACRRPGSAVPTGLPAMAAASQRIRPDS
jgi:hypothetical protein